MITEYYCPKCGSINVEVRNKHQEGKKRLPMDQMEVGSVTARARPMVLIIREKEAHCKDCGHTMPLLRQ